MSDFNPHSQDAMLATIIAKLDTLSEKSDRIEAQTVKTNGRVTALERWRDMSKAKVAGISLTVSVFVGFVTWFLR